MVRHTASALWERNRRLSCLYGVAKIARTSTISLRRQYQEIVESIPSGLQYPHIACAKLHINGQAFQTSNFQETSWKLLSTIKIRNRKAGTLEICYLQKQPTFDKRVFDAEEVVLLDSIAEWVATITEWKQAEDKMKESKRQLRVILDAIPAHVFYKNSQSQMVFVNRALAKLTGIPMKQWVGKTVESILPNLKYSYSEADREILATHKPKKGIIEPMYTPRGVVWLHTDKLPRKDEHGKIIGIVGFSIEITERIRAEDKVRLFQKRLRALISRLSSVQEHERREVAEELHDGTSQLLSLVKLKLVSLKNIVTSEEGIESISQIQELLEQALGNTRSLIFSLGSPILYRLGLEAALDWLIEQFNESSQINFSLRIRGQRNSLGYELRSFLFRTARELLTNALKHSEAKNVRVVLDYKCNSTIVELRVKDDGIGCKTSVIDNKHQCFGLFNIRERLKDIGGNFSLESAKGKGTSVIITVPSDHQD